MEAERDGGLKCVGGRRTDTGSEQKIMAGCRWQWATGWVAASEGWRWTEGDGVRKWEVGGGVGSREQCGLKVMVGGSGDGDDRVNVPWAKVMV